MASPPGPKKTDTAAATVTAAGVAVPESGGDPMDEEPAAGAVAEETPAAGDDSADKDGDDKAEQDGSDTNEPKAAESKTAVVAAASAPAETMEGVEAALEEEQGKENGEDPTTSNGEGGHGSPGETPGGNEEKEQEKVEGVDVYRRDMAWLRSAHGMVAEVRSFTKAYLSLSKNILSVG